jgi:hypothetical protein
VFQPDVKFMEIVKEGWGALKKTKGFINKMQG